MSCFNNLTVVSVVKALVIWRIFNWLCTSYLFMANNDSYLFDFSYVIVVPMRHIVLMPTLPSVLTRPSTMPAAMNTMEQAIDISW